VIPVKTSVDDIKKILDYLTHQIGWVETAKIEKALGTLDDRKISTMAALGLIHRDGGNLKTTPRGQLFSSGEQARALREAVLDVELYRATLEWVHYSERSEVTATEIGQYWESSHEDTLGNLSGTTLKDGAVCFGRIIDGAKLGEFTVGRGGKETRISLFDNEIDELVSNTSATLAEHQGQPTPAENDLTMSPQVPVAPNASPENLRQPSPATPVSVTTSPGIHVNVEIHIAADATADTVREIFKNMARYVLDKPVTDDAD